MEARRRFLRITLAVFYVFVLTMAGLGLNGTYSIFNTLARTPPGTAVAAGDGDILEVTGGFDAAGWLESGSSGLVVTNVSLNRLWVYFTVDGSLGDAIRHINPVCLNPGGKYEIPLRTARLGELGLLGWRNNEESFTGLIMARVLNNFSSYEIAEVTISGNELYAALVDEEDDSEGLLAGIRSVQDLLRLIAERASLIDERDQLQDERDGLIKANEALLQEREMLRDRVAALEDHVDTLSDSLSSAYDKIDQYRQQEEMPEQDTASDQTGTGESGPGDTGAGDTGSAVDDNAAEGETGSTGEENSDAGPDTPGESPEPADGEGSGTESGDTAGGETGSTGEETGDAGPGTPEESPEPADGEGSGTESGDTAGGETGSTGEETGDAGPGTPEESPESADGEGSSTEGDDCDSSAGENGDAVSDSGASGADETDAPDSGGGDFTGSLDGEATGNENGTATKAESVSLSQDGSDRNTGKSTGEKVALPGDVAPAPEKPRTCGQKEDNTVDE